MSGTREEQAINLGLAAQRTTALWEDAWDLQLWAQRRRYNTLYGSRRE
jgi:hypothetical protein